MAKRFTDTGKWRNGWFKDLAPNAKLVWLYLCDDCDHSGIWLAEFEVMSIRIGVKIDENRFIEWLGDKVIKFDKNKFFIPSFFDFQYGSSKEGFRAKQSAIASLQKYGLIDTQGTLIEQSTDCASISKSKSSSKSKSNTGSAEGDKFRPDLEAIYARYPRKEGKSQGLKKLEASIKTPSDETDANTALDAFLDHHRRLKTQAEFIPHFKTWANSWRDFLDPPYGRSDGFSVTIGPTEDWEAIAARVLEVVVKAGSGTQAHAERDRELGPDLHRIAIKAGIQRLRDVQRGPYQLKNIAELLQTAAQLMGGQDEKLRAVR